MLLGLWSGFWDWGGDAPIVTPTTGGGAGGQYLQFWLDKAKEAQQAVTQKNTLATRKTVQAIAAAPEISDFAPPKVTEQKAQDIDFERIYSDLQDFITRLETKLGIYSAAEENDEIALLLSIA